MKNFYILTCLLFCALGSSAQSVFFEDFESGVPGQLTQDYLIGTIDWVGDPTLVTLGPGPGAFEGDTSAYFYEGAYSGNITSLTTPTLDLSSGGYKLSFAHIQPGWPFGGNVDQNTLSVYVSSDDGATWTLIDSITADVQDYIEVEYLLDNYITTTTTTKIRFSGWIDFGYAIGLDVVNVFLPPADDAGAVTQITPSSGCALGVETVAITVFNNGLDTITSIDATYEVDAISESETFSVDIVPGGTDTLVFTTTVDLSSPGNYDFTAWVELAGDLNQDNDTITFSVQNIPVISTLPYMEDFESGAGGWVSGQIEVANSWELGLPTNTFIDTANSGVNAWVTNLDGDYVEDEESYVESPCMDFSSLSVDPVLRFAYMAQSESGWDGTWVELSFDAGATWTTLGSVGEGTNWYNSEDEHPAGDWWDDELSSSGDYLIATHLLDGAAGEASVKVRVRFSSDVSTVAEGFAFDDVEIFEQPSINAGVTEILSPVTGCGLGSELVTVVIENFGDADLVDFNIEYDGGAGVVTQTITDTLFSAQTDTVTFTVPVDLSVSGSYDLGVWTAIVGDGDMTNDSIFMSVTSSPVISVLPYMTDFESGADGWYSTGENGLWELGDPEGLLIDTAASGFNAWATNLNDTLYAADQLSYLISPCIDLSGLVIDPILEFSFIGNSEVFYDGMWLEASTDAGATWATVGNVGEGTNWYNQDGFVTFIDQGWDGNTADTVGWIVAEHLLDGVAGSSDVIIRFVFDSDDIVFGEGFAIDDISITEQPPYNGELTSIDNPMTGCGLTSTESISVTVTNLGSVNMDSVVIGYSLDNGPIITETFNDTLVPNESGSYTFAQTIDLSVAGEYDLEVWVTTIGDGETSNDSASTQVVNVPIVSSYPYMTDFESGTDGWYSTGQNGIWQLGDPEGTLIDTANSGVNAWVTNMDSISYGNNQLSYLLSPCLDFTSFTDDPVFEFAFISNSEPGWDGMWLEASTDGGITWATVGSFGEGVNWYNNEDEHGANFDEDWWDGNTSDPLGWIVAERILDGLAGNANVNLRFVFDSDGSNFQDWEGFGVDDISIRTQPQLDLVAISMDGPADGCSLSDEEVTMTFWNKGLMAVSNFGLGFSVDGNTAQTETYTGTVNHGDTVTFTFSSEFADLSIAGMHTIDVFTGLTGDEDLNSDTISGSAIENLGNSGPLAQSNTEALAIPDGDFSGVTSEIFFCGLPNLDGCLEIANVTIDSLAHGWMSDVDLYLISPAGDTLELSTDNGGTGDNMYNVVFTDTSSNDITLQTDGVASGYYHPEDSIGFAGLYNGQDPNGSWSILAVDDEGIFAGTLLGWSMTFQNNTPMPVLTQGDTTICVSQTLAVGVSEYDSYLWSTNDNSQEVDLVGDVLGLGTTEISVTVDQDGCTATSNSFMLTVDECAGIDELSGLNIDIYPNPTSNDVVLDVDGESDGFVLDILDMNGKVVYTETIGEILSGLRKTIDLTSVANGLYFLRLDDGTSSTARKLIKQ